MSETFKNIIGTLKIEGSLDEHLRTLPADIRRALLGADPTKRRIARAAALLADDRERVAAILQPLFSDVMDPADLARCTRDLLEDAGREIDVLRTRVAELEARLARADELARELTRERDSEAEHAAELEAECIRADRTIRRLSAPDGTRAATLLNAIEEAAREAKRSADDGPSTEAATFAAAANIIRAHLGDPTPAERVAASALAFMPAVMGIDGRQGTAEAACADIARECAEKPSHVGFLTMAALAIAGALAIGGEEPGK